MIETLPRHSPEERRQAIKESHYNLFSIPASYVTFDFLTDSGTSAMSSLQWAAMLRGDESYAGSSSFETFQQTIHQITGMQHVIPTHQGRSAEALLCQVMLSPGQSVVGNTHFDTTRANIELVGSTAIDLPSNESKQNHSDYPFKGNVDVERLRLFLEQHSSHTALFIMTVTNNSIGGQPVSLKNIEETRQILNKYNIPLFIDAARFAENAYFIKCREPSYSHLSIRQIAQEMFALADGVVMSAKKDAFANIGGFLAVKSKQLASTIRQRMVITEGFPTYGGLAGRDLEAIAQGLQEVLEEDYLAYRIRSVSYFGEGLENAGFKVVKPFGGHAVYIDAKETVPHIPPAHFPAQALAINLFTEIGLRGVEVGSLMFGSYDPLTQQETPATKELVRLALPRRVYTQSHIDYIIECARELYPRLGEVPGYRIIEQSKFLRHFTAKLSPV